MPRKGQQQNKKLQFIADPNAGCFPLANAEHESIIQEIIKNPCIDYAELGKKYGHAETYVWKMFYKDEVKQRYNFLLSKSANKALISRDMIISGILRETKIATRPGDRLKAWELLGKTQAMFSEKVQVTGLPKRLVIRTETATEEIRPDVSSTDD